MMRIRKEINGSREIKSVLTILENHGGELDGRLPEKDTKEHIQ